MSKETWARPTLNKDALGFIQTHSTGGISNYRSFGSVSFFSAVEITQKQTLQIECA